MMWVFVPTRYCPSAPEAGDSTSASLWRSEMLASSAALNTKHLPSSSWQRAWTKGGWMRRLYGRIYTPSMADRGVAAFRESLAVIPASRSRSQDGGAELMTRDISGRPSRGSSLSVSLPGVSSRTWQDTFGLDTGTLFGPTSNALATASRKASSRRRKLAQATNGSGSSSTHAWSTPHAHNAHGEPGKAMTANDGRHRDLVREAAMWPTPVANDDNKTPEAHMAMKARMKGGPRHTATSLQVVSQMWPTPDTMPEAPNSGSNRINGPKSLGEAAQWATPSGSDYKGSTPGAVMRQDGKQRDRLDYQSEQLWQTESRSFRPDQANASDGLPSSQSIPDSPPRLRLNPAFVEWLMGWPSGWSSLAQPGCESLETEWSRWRLRMHSALCALTWKEGDDDETE